MTGIANWKINWERYLARFVHTQHITRVVDEALTLLKLVTDGDIGYRVKK
jgi:hypothetical protein